MVTKNESSFYRAFAGDGGLVRVPHRPNISKRRDIFARELPEDKRKIVLDELEARRLEEEKLYGILENEFNERLPAFTLASHIVNPNDRGVTMKINPKTKNFEVYTPEGFAIADPELKERMMRLMIDEHGNKTYREESKRGEESKRDEESKRGEEEEFAPAEEFNAEDWLRPSPS